MCLREKIGPDPRNFNQRVSLGRNDLLIRTFPSALSELAKQFWENEDNAFQYLDRDNLLYHRYPFSRTNFSHGFSGSQGYQNGLRKPSQRAVTRTPLA
jgi:hypothetical protein